MTRAKKKKFIKNLWKFTAPVMAVFFGQLALKADVRVAGLVALYALYAALQDYLKKVK